MKAKSCGTIHYPRVMTVGLCNDDCIIELEGSGKKIKLRASASFLMHQLCDAQKQIIAGRRGQATDITSNVERMRRLMTEAAQ